MKALFVKSLHGLVPVDEQGEAMLAKWKRGDAVMVDVRRPRNPYHHRLMFAVAKLVVENSEHYSSVEQFIEDAKFYAGHVERHVTWTGKAHWRTKSISFASMSQDDFAPFFDKTIELACKVLSIDAPTMLDEVNQMVAA